MTGASAFFPRLIMAKEKEHGLLRI
jgi:hypothetical protein